MRYYFIDTLGDLASGYCILISPPESLGLSFYKMANGERVAAEYPEAARIYMSEQQPGIKVPSIVGNTQSYLITSGPVKEEIEVLCAGVDVEYLPFTLYNHKRRPTSGSFFIINPIGSRDCLDMEASVIEYLDAPGDPYDRAIVGVDRFVLTPEKLDGAPSLFRVREEPNRYVLDERLADRLRARGFSNFILTELEQSRR